MSDADAISELIWRAVIGELASDGVTLHSECAEDEPMECTLYMRIYDVVNGEPT